MKKNLTILALTVFMASCARKETPVLAETVAVESATVAESAFRAAPMKSKASSGQAVEVRPTRPAVKTAPLKLTLAEGTVLAVRVGETLNSEKNQSGDSWTGVLAEPVVVNGLVIGERGAQVEGRVTDVKRAGKVKGVATLRVALNRFVTADGQRVDINTNSFAAVGRDETKKDVGTVAIASGIGAAIGAIAGHGKGAAIGAGAGAAAGSGVVLATRGGPAIISNEALIRFRIVEPVTFTERAKKL